MNANRNVPSKVTIKVKLCDEDYHDIVLDWSDESCEYKQQLFMRKLASYTRVPIEYFTNVIFFHGWTTRLFRNQETKFRAELVEPAENETFMSIFSDGDCFCLNPIFTWSDQYKSFVVAFELATLDQVNVSQCDWFWCQYRNTRALMDRRIRILKSSELVAKLNAASERRHVDNSDEFRKIFADFDINQAVSDVLGCRDENNPDENSPEYRSYPSYRG